MTGKEAALEQIAALTTAHGISVGEIQARLARDEPPTKQRSFVAQLLSYLGGAFVFSGISLLISFIWHDIGSAQRVILTFGSGLAALVLGVVCGQDTRFARAATPLFLVAACLQPFGLVVFLQEYLPPSGHPERAVLAIAGTLAVQQGLAFWALRRSSLLFFGIGFAAIALTAFLQLVDVADEPLAIAVGLAVLGTASVVSRTAHAPVTPFWYFVGSASLLGGWWVLWEGTALDLSTLGLSVALIALSIRTGSRTLLFVAAVGLLGYLSYFAYEYFADVVGWPIALILLGLAMLGVGGWVMKLSRRIPRR